MYAPNSIPYICPEVDQMPVWIIGTTMAGLYCVSADKVGDLMQENQCTDESGQLLFNGDGRLVCFAM